MPASLHRRRLLACLLGLGVAPLARVARACEIEARNLRVTHPWTRATSPGDAWAVVGMKIDAVTLPDRLIGVESPVAAGAVLAGPNQADTAVDLPIPAGEETLLAEDRLHVRLVGLRAPLEFGRTYPLTLRFARGDVVVTQLTVDYPRA
jgi:copper(I)-binding protein